MINQVIITGKLASEPKRIVTPDRTVLYLFTIASVGPTGRFVFPPIVTDRLPDFVTFKPNTRLNDQPTLTVIGWLRTVNVELDLKNEVLRLARKARVPGRIVKRLDAVLSKANDARVPRVTVDVFAEQIIPGGEWL